MLALGLLNPNPKGYLGLLAESDNVTHDLCEVCYCKLNLTQQLEYTQCPCSTVDLDRVWTDEEKEAHSRAWLLRAYASVGLELPTFKP